MNEQSPETETLRRIGMIDRLIMSPTCVRFDVLETCPGNDIAMVRKLGIMMWLTFAWISVLLANASRVMFSPNGEWQPAHIAIAVLVSAIVLLADALIFIAASHHMHGLAELIRTGRYKPHATFGIKAKTGTLIASRFVMAMLSANFSAVVAGLLAFDEDTRIVIEHLYQRSNATLTAEKNSSENAELAKSAQQQTELRGQIANAEQEERRLRTIIVEPTADEPQMRQALDRIARAETAKTEAERALTAAQADSANEIGGTCRISIRGGCKPGIGPRWRAAQERIAAAKVRIAQAAQAAETAKMTMRELQAARAGEMLRKVEAAKARLAEVTQNKTAQESELVALTNSYHKRRSERERVIREAIENDPRHVPRDQGLLARLRALKELMKEPAVAALVYLFDGMLMLLELAAVVGKAISFVPMTYATKLAELDLMRAHETAHRVTHAIARFDLIPPPKPKPFDPDDGAGAPATQPKPPSLLGGAAKSALGGRRHAPRWQPPLRSARSEVPADKQRPAPLPAPTQVDDEAPLLPAPA